MGYSHQGEDLKRVDVIAVKLVFGRMTGHLLVILGHVLKVSWRGLLENIL